MEKIKLMGKFLRFILFPDVSGISLAPFGIYFREKRYLTVTRRITHESIHWKQQMEMLVIFFYIWYLLEWFIRLFINWGNAYRSISFEREAFCNENNPEYLKSRKPFSWLYYLVHKS
jgi:hypothetical protein